MKKNQPQFLLTIAKKHFQRTSATATSSEKQQSGRRHNARRERKLTFLQRRYRGEFTSVLPVDRHVTQKIDNFDQTTCSEPLGSDWSNARQAKKRTIKPSGFGQPATSTIQN